MLGIMSGRLKKHSRPSDPLAHRGFTLVEMLVVIGIIVVLIGILLPLLSRVRESGRRTKCGANLHTIGEMAIAFANDHGGLFPACYRMRDVPPRSTSGQAFPFRIPTFITQDTTYDSDSSRVGWTQFGTSWQVWATYAAKNGSPPSQGTSQTPVDYQQTLTDYYSATLATFSCPSSDKPAHMWDYTNDPAFPSGAGAPFGPVVALGYMYVGGLSDASMAVPAGIGGNQNHSTSHWSKAPPAMTTGGSPMYQMQWDTQASIQSEVQLGAAPPSSTVLAADIVYWDGTIVQPASKQKYVINHPQRGTPTLPDFQNVLYGDGRVEGHGREEYPYPLNDDSQAAQQDVWNWSMKFAGGQPGYFYWGEAESMPTIIPASSTDFSTSPYYGDGPVPQKPPWAPNTITVYIPPIPSSEGTLTTGIPSF